MNNGICDHHSTIPISIENMVKINPYNQPKNPNVIKNVYSKRKNNIPTSNREFGKEINNTSNLTVINNQDNFNNRRSLRIPNDKKMKKDNPFKNDQQIAVRKRKKQNSISFHKKSNSSSCNMSINKNEKEKEKEKKEKKKLKNKNKSQRNIFGQHNIISINDDIVMKDENINPNIITKENSFNINNSINNNNNNKGLHKTIDSKSISEKKVNEKINVQNVDEYFNDICRELFKNEEKYLVNPNYMSNQSDINFRMRAILIDWLIDVHLKYKLVPQTMYIAVNLIDRYLSKNDTNRNKLQLVGVTAMFIACKYEEIYPPELKDFVYITDGAYVKSDVLHMEYKMLKSLDFNVTFPTQWSIFEIYKKKLNLNEKTFKLAWFLMELCLINSKSLKFKMSVLAASAILIATKTLGIYKSNWFCKNIGFEEKDLEDCCKELYDFYVYNSTHKLQAIRKKFSHSKFDEVAKIKLVLNEI